MGFMVLRLLEWARRGAPHHVKHYFRNSRGIFRMILMQTDFIDLGGTEGYEKYGVNVPVNDFSTWREFYRKDYYRIL